MEGGRDLAPGINQLLHLPFTIKVASQDWHPEDHASFATNHEGPNNEPFRHTTTMTNPSNPAETKESTLWPPHCIQHTPGAAIISEIDANRLDRIVYKGMDARVEMYSAFADIFGNKAGATFDLEDFLREQGITHVYTCGLTGECCVFESALGARKAGFEVIFLRDLTRSVSDEPFQAALKQMESAGVQIADSSGPEVSRVRDLI